MAEDKVIVPIELTVTDIKTGDIDLKDVQKSMESKLASIAKSASDVLGKVDTSKLNKALTDSMEKVQDSYQKLATAKAKFNDAMNSAGSSSPKFKKELEAIQAEMEKTESSWKSFADHLLSNPTLQRALDKRDMGLSLSSSETDALRMFDTAADDYDAKMSELRKSMPKPSDFLSTATTVEMQNLVKAYNEIFNAVNKVDSATKRWNDTKSNNQFTDEYTTKLKELETYEKKLETVKAKAEKMSEIGASDKSWSSLSYDVDLLDTKIRGVIESLQEMVRTGSAFRFNDGDSAGQMAMLEDRLANVDNAMSQIPTSANDTQTKMNALLTTVKNFSTSTINGLKGVISMFKKLGKTGSKSGNDIGKSLKKMWRNILMFGFGVRSTYFLVKRLRRIFVESFKEMATQIPEVNADVSSFMTSMNQLKGSLATAFQPIVSAVIPLLNNLTASLTNAMNAVGKFFATLTGQGYIYKFTADQVDYADSLDNTTNSAKKAQKALMGFDEINRLNDDSDSGNSGGNTPTGTWEKEMLGSASTLAELIKEAWSDGDFYDVGQYIGEKLLLALQTADDYITTKGYAFAEKIGKSLGTLINGVVETEGLGNQIGKTLADAFNMALIGIDTFLTTTDWINLGKFIADWANASVQNFDWSLLGKTVADVFKAAIDTAWSFIGEFDFSGLGNKLSTAINSLFSNILSEDGSGLNVAEKLGQTISDAVKGILTTLTTTISNTDWSAVGKTLSDVLSNIDWPGIVSNLFGVIGSALGGLGAFIAGLFEDAIASMGDYFTGQIEDAGGDIVLGIFNGIIDALSNIGTWIVDSIFTPFINGFKDAFGINSPSTVMAEQGIYIIEGLMSGILAAIAGIKEWLNTNVVNPIKNVFDGVGTSIETAFSTCWTGIKDTWKNVTTWFKDNVTSKLKDRFSTLDTNIKSSFSSCWSGIKNTWKNVTTWFRDNVTSKVKDRFSTLGSNIKTAFSNCWSGIKSTWGNVKTWFGNIATGVQSKFKTVTDKIKSMFSSAWSAVKSGCKSSFNSVIASVEKGINALISGVNKIVSGLNKVAQGAAKITGKNIPTIPTIPTIKLPRLAQGGVIPPNKEFMAILGDQKHGTNIEAPLDTIKQAVAEELTEYIDAMMTGFKAVVDAVNDKDLAVSIGDREVGKAAERYFTRQAVIRGT